MEAWRTRSPVHINHVARRSAMPAELAAVHPVLVAREVAASLAFYARLGFASDFLDDSIAPRYAVVRRGPVELHLQWADSSQWAHAGDRPAYRSSSHPTWTRCMPSSSPRRPHLRHECIRDGTQPVGCTGGHAVGYARIPRPRPGRQRAAVLPATHGHSVAVVDVRVSSRLSRATNR